MDNSHAVREMRRAILELSIKVTAGELLDIERVTSSSERGGWKRAEIQYLAGRLLYLMSGSEVAAGEGIPLPTITYRDGATPHRTANST